MAEPDPMGAPSKVLPLELLLPEIPAASLPLPDGGIPPLDVLVLVL